MNRSPSKESCLLVCEVDKYRERLRAKGIALSLSLFFLSPLSLNLRYLLGQPVYLGSDTD
jgi:hypothetical protein